MTHKAGEPTAPRYYWKNPSSGKSSAALRTGYQADILRKYPMGNSMARPLFNDYHKRYGGSTTGGGSIGSAM